MITQEMTDWAFRIRVRGGRHGLAARLRLAPSPADGAIVPAGIQIGASLLLLAPFLVAVAALGLHHIFALDGPQRMLTSAERGGARTAVLHTWVLIGPALAVALNAMWMTRLHVARSSGEVAANITFRIGVARGLALILTLFVAAAFYGHLAADAIACSNGVLLAC
jgi:hypothetical protein